MRVSAFFYFWSRIMEEQRSPLHFRTNDEDSAASGRAEWQTQRRPRRGRRPARTAEERGPYESSYSILTGYPEREIVTP
jgi:hypothetical protein